MPKSLILVNKVMRLLIATPRLATSAPAHPRAKQRPHQRIPVVMGGIFQAIVS